MFLVTTRDILGFFFFPSLDFLSVFGYRLRKMSDFSINRVLGDFTIAKGVLLRGYHCLVFGMSNSGKHDRWNPDSGLISSQLCTQMFRFIHVQLFGAQL